MSLRTRMRGLGIAALGLMISAVAYAQETPAPAGSAVKPRYTTWWLPDQASTVAPKIDDMFYLILWLTSVVFVGVFATQIYFMIRYRRREGGKAIYSHGNNRLEIVWTILPALILIFLGVLSQSLWSEIKQAAPSEAQSFVVEIRPRQFQWDIRYSGADGRFDTPDDINAINNLHVPVGKAVILNMTAQDVIHSFFVPEFRIKQDAVPGMLTQQWFTATKVGEYEIACAELCGLGHFRMRGRIFIHSQADFDTWYAGEQAKRQKALTPPAPAPATPSAGSNDSTQTPPKPPTSPAGTGDTTGGSGGDTTKGTDTTKGAGTTSGTTTR